MTRCVALFVVFAMLPAGTAWAARCAGYAESRIVFCDDFDQYCTANNPTNPWPGYPPTPDTQCGTDATKDSAFFRQSQHWASMCGAGFDMMGIETDSWGIEGGSNPFYARLYGETATAQYHRWDLGATIAAKNPGYNGINGTDEKPIYLRWFLANNGNPTDNAVMGAPAVEPLYVELSLDDDRAPTDYVVKDCMFYYDCNCSSSNPDGICDTGTCQYYTCAGSCDFHFCVNGACADGPRAGQVCGRDSQCSVCSGGSTPGAACTADYDCSACDGGPKQGQKCSSDSACLGTCSAGPRIGDGCASNADCGSCVGGPTPGKKCDSDPSCRYTCLPGQSPTCDGGIHHGMLCEQDAQCAGGPVYPIVTQQRLNSQIGVPHPGLTTTVRKSIAYGLLAQLDVDPCNLENNRRPTNYHSNVFDGVKWTDLRSNVFPGNSGDFNNDGRTSVYQMWVKSSSFVVWLDSFVGGESNFPGVPQHSEATVPRQYLGPFNRISMGAGPGCELDPNTGACITGDACWDYPRVYANTIARWPDYSIDNLVMLDGVLLSTSGACCLNDASCLDAAEADCLAQGGHFQGTNTSCAATTCCPYPFADTDTDSDVDQDDFGAFQLCYNGSGVVPTGCACFDRNGDGHVDSTDFTSFGNCYTGPNVPWSQAVTPSCSP